VVIRRAITRVSERLQFLRFGIRPFGIEVGVAGRSRDDVGYGSPEYIVDLVRRLIARYKLAASRMTRYDDRPQVWKDFLPDDPAQQFVGKIKRRYILIIDRGSARAPAVPVTRPIDFARSEGVHASALIVRCESREYHKRVVKSAGKERGG